MKIENQELRDLLTDKEQLSQAVELLMEQNKAYRQQQEEMKKLLDEAKRDAEDLRDQLEHSTLHQSNNHLFDELQDDENTLIIDGASPSSFTGKPTFGGRENRPPNIKETSIPLEEGNEEFKIPSQTFVNNPQQTESSSSKLKTELGVERRAKGKSLSNIPLEEAIPDNGNFIQFPVPTNKSIFNSTKRFQGPRILSQKRKKKIFAYYERPTFVFRNSRR